MANFKIIINPGQTIDEAYFFAKGIATQITGQVEFVFNGITCLVDKTSSDEMFMKAWRRACQNGENNLT